MILSPAKKMNEDTEAFEAVGLPVLIRQTEEVLGWLRSKSYEELKELWNCNDKIAKQSFERLNGMDLSCENQYVFERAVRIRQT